MSANFDLAPPAKTVDGLLSVPVDIESISAVFTFDGAAQTATADATMTYTVGPTVGHPFFDLRQNITQAWLDGVLFPVAQLAHHVFGATAFTNLRVIESLQAAGSVHTLRVLYTLSLPDSQLGGSYLPALDWLAGPKLRFVFGLSDLNKARYAEAWLPANLIFDQFRIDLEMQITGTMATHSVISNGAITPLGANHWSISFPDRFTAISPMLEIRASDSLVQHVDSVVLPVSGKTVAIEAWKPSGSAVNLLTETANIKTFLIENENDYGGYAHENRFVAFFNGSGGMEYEGGTTTSTGALRHETFHSWFARGIKPSSQADGWWDEGFTTFHDDGANDVIPFDFTQPPVLLCSRDPWQRNTPGNSYADGSDFWKGIAAIVGVANLNAMAGDLYDAHKGNPISTAMIEEFLLCRSGNPDIVDAFHRFVFGLANPSPAPELWMRDDPADPGNDQWGGAFWDSPDLWIRNHDDGGLSHQSPEFGQDNWFHARVRNKAPAGNARHFVVTFHPRGFLGTQFEYPDDFLPCTAAKAEFDLAGGDTRIVKAKWPQALVPAAGTHTCLLASVVARGDHPVAGRHVWEHNNLAQKNLEVVDLQAETYVVLPIVIRNWKQRFDPRFSLEVWQPEGVRGVRISLIHASKALLKSSKAKVRRFKPEFAHRRPRQKTVRLECGSELLGHGANHAGRVLTSDVPELLLRRFPDAWEAEFDNAPRATLAVEIPAFTQAVVGLKIASTGTAKERFKIHFVQRNSKTDSVTGGVAIQCNCS
jgi:hypothetical protein